MMADFGGGATSAFVRPAPRRLRDATHRFFHALLQPASDEATFVEAFRAASKKMADDKRRSAETKRIAECAAFLVVVSPKLLSCALSRLVLHAHSSLRWTHSDALRPPNVLIFFFAPVASSRYAKKVDDLLKDMVHSLFTEQPSDPLEVRLAAIGAALAILSLQLLSTRP